MRLEGKSLRGDFFRFIIPSIIAQLVFSLYTMVDGIFVARGVSETALAAINIVMPFPVAMFSLALMFAVGNSTIVAIYLGEGKKKEADEAFTQNIIVLCVISVCVTVAVLLFLEPLVLFLGATDAILPYAKEYVGTIAPFAFAYILSYSFETLIKTDGYPRQATIYVTVGAVLNCLLDYLMVMVWHWGVRGAAVATGISQTVVIVFYLIHFLGRNGTIKFCRFPFRGRMVLRQMRNGLSSGVTEFSSGIIIFFFNHAILMFIGEWALVSYTIVSYVNTIVVMSLTGIAQGSQPLISYYYGKKELEKCKKLFRYGVLSGIVFAAACTAFCWIFAGGIVGLFLEGRDQELTEASVQVLRVFVLSFLPASFNVVAGGFFTSMEKAWNAAAISITRGFAALVGCLFLLGFLFGGNAIWWAPLLAEGICLGFSFIFLNGRME